jgi:lysozyme family protein
MQHPYEALKGEYAQLIAAAHIRPECEHVLQKTAERLLHDKPVYQRIFDATGVPVAVLMALSEREMSGNLHCYLGNGQRLTMRTTIVPKNRGPFPDTIDGFVAGALDALHLDGLDQVARTTEGWSMPRFGYESEDWNGFGYRLHGIPTPYFVGGTTVQKPGKFVRDHVYSTTKPDGTPLMDPQLGTLAIVEELFKIDPSLIFAPGIAKVDDAPSIVPMPAPVGVGGGVDVKTLQAYLGIRVDGIYGRGTKEAVRVYQRNHGLAVDGLAGPQTLESLGLVAA